MKKKHPEDCNFDYPWVLVTNVKWEAEAIEEMLKENRARANIKTTYFKKNMKAFFEKKRLLLWFALLLLPRCTHCTAGCSKL